MIMMIIVITINNYNRKIIRYLMTKLLLMNFVEYAGRRKVQTDFQRLARAGKQFVDMEYSFNVYEQPL